MKRISISLLLLVAVVFSSFGQTVVLLGKNEVKIDAFQIDKTNLQIKKGNFSTEDAIEHFTMELHLAIQTALEAGTLPESILFNVKHSELDGQFCYSIRSNLQLLATWMVYRIKLKNPKDFKGVISAMSGEEYDKKISKLFVKDDE